MFCLGGFCPGGFWQGGFLSTGFLSGGLCPGGFCPRTVNPFGSNQLKIEEAQLKISLIQSDSTFKNNNRK